MTRHLFLLSRPDPVIGIRGCCLCQNQADLNKHLKQNGRCGVSVAPAEIEQSPFKILQIIPGEQYALPLKQPFQGHPENCLVILELDPGKGLPALEDLASAGSLEEFIPLCLTYDTA